MEGSEAVQATNDDASECKRCAVHLGYWDDNYINLFIRHLQRKAPEINRGYYARSKGVGLFVDKFLEHAGNNAQIINLGAGFDTLYWRLRDRKQPIKNYIEIDFPAVTSKKCFIIKKNKTLLEGINVEDGEVRLSSTDLHAANFHIVSSDLSKLSQLEAKLHESEVSFNAPTLFLAECVLVYIGISQVNQLLKWIIEKFPNCFFVSYEQVNMDDKFGEIMLRNLRARGCLLAGVEACRTLQTQQQRFLDTGWDGAQSWDMVNVYQELPHADRQRIEKIEFLDEHEVLTQLMQHYCITVAWHGEIVAGAKDAIGQTC